jgi:hypothetical protein
LGQWRKSRAEAEAKGKAELLEHITSNDYSLGPVTFAREHEVLIARLEQSKLQPRFVFEYQHNWTRKSRMEAVERLRRAHGRKLIPLLLTPYLSEQILDELVEERISAIDGCGNGLLIAPPGLFILTGGKKPKQHRKRSPPARLAIYESSNVATLVPRVFLSYPSFPTTTAVLDACHARIMALADTPTPLTLSTVSKALRQLDEELVTESRGRERRLRDPERLLQHLERGFRLPSASPVLLKTRLSADELWPRLHEQRPNLEFVMTGRASATHYTSLAGPERLQLYVSDSSLAQQALQAKASSAFPNLELIETADEAPYFDSYDDSGVILSSRLQCYLELARVGADPREREMAERLRVKILGDIRAAALASAETKS